MNIAKSAAKEDLFAIHRTWPTCSFSEQSIKHFLCWLLTSATYLLAVDTKQRHLAAPWPPPGHLWPVSSPHGNCSSGLHIHAQLTSNLAKLHVVFLDTLLAILPKRCNSYSLIWQGYLYEGRKILILESDYLFPCFIKLLIDSIHPFTLGVDCVSKWQRCGHRTTTGRARAGPGQQRLLSCIRIS